jgi:hypothetical protein
VSKPSNVVGPVAVKEICLVDELQDFSVVEARSAGLTLENAYNGMYAEYLFRAKGAVQDWVIYKVPGEIRSVKLVAWFAGNVSDPKLQSSADGKTFADLQAQRRERAMPSPPGGAARGKRRTMVEYECSPPAGMRRLKIQWTGPAELDRVEIYHSGG